MNAQAENLGGQNWAYGGEFSVIESSQPHKKIARATLGASSSRTQWSDFHE